MSHELILENQETTEQKIARLFQERGRDDDEAKKLLINWMIEKEKLVRDSEDAIQFNLERARLYLACGLKAEALENFHDAKNQAYQENRDELCQMIEREIVEIEK
ncbi:MAG: hypothetical protein WC310_01745 [Patescibacteria group bacterium]|jgi:hypothetical protein